MANEPSSWTIILPIATGICGYLGGIISEPLKQITTQWLAKKRMKNVVYAELAHNLDSLVLMTLFGEETGDTYKAKVYRDVLDLNISYKNFEFAETQPLIFHALREATNIRNIYSGFHLFLDGAETKQAISAGIETLINEVQQRNHRRWLQIRNSWQDTKLPNLNKHLAELKISTRPQTLPQLEPPKP